MRKIILAIIILFFNFTQLNSIANAEIVFLNVEKVLNSSNAGKQVKKKLEEMQSKNRKKFEEISKELRKNEEDILSKKNILSKEDFDKEIKKLQVKLKESNTKRNKTIEEFNKKKSKYMKKLLDELAEVLTDYSEKNSVSMILDEKNVFMGNTNLNITDKILEIYNSKVKKIKLD